MGLCLNAQIQQRAGKRQHILSGRVQPKRVRLDDATLKAQLPYSRKTLLDGCEFLVSHFTKHDAPVENLAARPVLKRWAQPIPTGGFFRMLKVEVRKILTSQ